MSSNRTMHAEQSPCALFDFCLRLIHAKIALCLPSPPHISPTLKSFSHCSLGQGSFIHPAGIHRLGLETRKTKSGVSRSSAPRELCRLAVETTHKYHFNSLCLELKKGLHRKLGTQSPGSQFIPRLMSINRTPEGDGRRLPWKGHLTATRGQPGLN